MGASFKAVFNYWWSWSHRWNHKRTSIQVKISCEKKMSRKKNHKLSSMESEPKKPVLFHFLQIPPMTHMPRFQWRLDCWSHKQRWKKQSITTPFLWPFDGLRLQQSSFHWMVGDYTISSITIYLLTLSAWLSLNHFPLHFWKKLQLWLHYRRKPALIEPQRTLFWVKPDTRYIHMYTCVRQPAYRGNKHCHKYLVL